MSSSWCCRTYSTLIGQGKGSKTRLQQVVDWAGGPDFDGCLVFDEVSPRISDLFPQCQQHISVSVSSQNDILSVTEAGGVSVQCHKAKNFVPGKEAQSTKVLSLALPVVISHRLVLFILGLSKAEKNS